MTDLHGLTDSDFAAYEADMLSAERMDFNTWANAVDLDARNGWLDMMIIIKPSHTGDTFTLDCCVENMIVARGYYGFSGLSQNWICYNWDDMDDTFKTRPADWSIEGATYVCGCRFNEFSGEMSAPMLAWFDKI